MYKCTYTLTHIFSLYKIKFPWVNLSDSFHRPSIWDKLSLATAGPSGCEHSGLTPPTPSARASLVDSSCVPGHEQHLCHRPDTVKVLVGTEPGCRGHKQEINRQKAVVRSRVLPKKTRGDPEKLCQRVAFLWAVREGLTKEVTSGLCPAGRRKGWSAGWEPHV